MTNGYREEDWEDELIQNYGQAKQIGPTGRLCLRAHLEQNLVPPYANANSS